MKKYIIIGAVIVLAAVPGGYLYLSSKKADQTTKTSSAAAAPATQAQEQGQPARTAELKGYVASIEGNSVVIINEISDEPELTDEEKAAKKAERQAMSVEERQALKEEESSNVEKENVSIVIPVGVPVMKTSGDASGTLADAELSEIKEGVYVSIWVKNSGAANQLVEFVKIRGATE